MSDPSAHEDPEDFPVAEIKVSRFADHDAATYPVYEGKNILGSDSRTARVYVRPGRLIMKTHLTIDCSRTEVFIADEPKPKKENNSGSEIKPTKMSSSYMRPGAQYLARHNEKFILNGLILFTVKMLSDEERQTRPRRKEIHPRVMEARAQMATRPASQDTEPTSSERPTSQQVHVQYTPQPNDDNDSVSENSEVKCTLSMADVTLSYSSSVLQGYSMFEEGRRSGSSSPEIQTRSSSPEMQTRNILPAYLSRRTMRWNSDTLATQISTEARKRVEPYEGCDADTLPYPDGDDYQAALNDVDVNGTQSLPEEAASLSLPEFEEATERANSGIRGGHGTRGGSKKRGRTAVGGAHNSATDESDEDFGSDQPSSEQKSQPKSGRRTRQKRTATDVSYTSSALQATKDEESNTAAAAISASSSSSFPSTSTPKTTRKKRSRSTEDTATTASSQDQDQDQDPTDPLSISVSVDDEQPTTLLSPEGEPKPKPKRACKSEGTLDSTHPPPLPSSSSTRSAGTDAGAADTVTADTLIRGHHLTHSRTINPSDHALSYGPRSGIECCRSYRSPRLRGRARSRNFGSMVRDPYRSGERYVRPTPRDSELRNARTGRARASDRPLPVFVKDPGVDGGQSEEEDGGQDDESKLKNTNKDKGEGDSKEPKTGSHDTAGKDPVTEGMESELSKQYGGLENHTEHAGRDVKGKGRALDTKAEELVDKSQLSAGDIKTKPAALASSSEAVLRVLNGSSSSISATFIAPDASSSDVVASIDAQQQHQQQHSLLNLPDTAHLDLQETKATVSAVIAAAIAASLATKKYLAGDSTAQDLLLAQKQVEIRTGPGKARATHAEPSPAFDCLLQAATVAFKPNPASGAIGVLASDRTPATAATVNANAAATVTVTAEATDPESLMTNDGTSSSSGNTKPTCKTKAVTKPPKGTCQWLLCLECRQEYYADHPELLKDVEAVEDGTKNRRITTSTACGVYNLRDSEIYELEFDEYANPHYASAAPMRLFDRFEVQRLALSVHGGWVGVDAFSKQVKERKEKRLTRPRKARRYRSYRYGYGWRGYGRGY